MPDSSSHPHGCRGNIIDPYNPTIKSIGDSLWSQSSSFLDYAEKCYEYVACSFKYISPGFDSLTTMLNNGGGDCGNLSSIYISLLRYKGIPSRHLITIRPDGSYHVWADFYLENYGWIPVDVTYKNGNKSGNYFGSVNVDSNGIIFTKSVDLPVDIGDGDVARVQWLQTYAYYYWYLNSGGGELTRDFSITSYPQ